MVSLGGGDGIDEGRLYREMASVSDNTPVLAQPAQASDPIQPSARDKGVSAVKTKWKATIERAFRQLFSTKSPIEEVFNKAIKAFSDEQIREMGGQDAINAIKEKLKLLRSGLSGLQEDRLDYVAKELKTALTEHVDNASTIANVFREQLAKEKPDIKALTVAEKITFKNNLVNRVASAFTDSRVFQGSLLQRNAKIPHDTQVQTDSFQAATCGAAEHVTRPDTIAFLRNRYTTELTPAHIALASFDSHIEMGDHNLNDDELRAKRAPLLAKVETFTQKLANLDRFEAEYPGKTWFGSNDFRDMAKRYALDVGKMNAVAGLVNARNHTITTSQADGTSTSRTIHRSGAIADFSDGQKLFELQKQLDGLKKGLKGIEEKLKVKDLSADVKAVLEIKKHAKQAEIADLKDAIKELKEGTSIKDLDSKLKAIKGQIHDIDKQLKKSGISQDHRTALTAKQDALAEKKANISDQISEKHIATKLVDDQVRLGAIDEELQNINLNLDLTEAGKVPLKAPLTLERAELVKKIAEKCSERTVDTTLGSMEARLKVIDTELDKAIPDGRRSTINTKRTALVAQIAEKRGVLQDQFLQLLSSQYAEAVKKAKEGPPPPTLKDTFVLTQMSLMTPDKLKHLPAFVQNEGNFMKDMATIFNEFQGKKITFGPPESGPAISLDDTIQLPKDPKVRAPEDGVILKTVFFNVAVAPPEDTLMTVIHYIPKNKGAQKEINAAAFQQLHSLLGDRGKDLHKDALHDRIDALEAELNKKGGSYEIAAKILKLSQEISKLKADTGEGVNCFSGKDRTGEFLKRIAVDAFASSIPDDDVDDKNNSRLLEMYEAALPPDAKGRAELIEEFRAKFNDRDELRSRYLRSRYSLTIADHLAEPASMLQQYLTPPIDKENFLQVYSNMIPEGRNKSEKVAAFNVLLESFGQEMSEKNTDEAEEYRKQIVGRFNSASCEEFNSIPPTREEKLLKQFEALFPKDRDGKVVEDRAIGIFKANLDDKPKLRQLFEQRLVAIQQAKMAAFIEQLPNKLNGLRGIIYARKEDQFIESFKALIPDTDPNTVKNAIVNEFMKLMIDKDVNAITKFCSKLKLKLPMSNSDEELNFQFLLSTLPKKELVEEYEKYVARPEGIARTIAAENIGSHLLKLWDQTGLDVAEKIRNVRAVRGIAA